MVRGWTAEVPGRAADLSGQVAAAEQLVPPPPVRLQAVVVMLFDLATVLLVDLVALMCGEPVMRGRAAAATLVGTRVMCGPVAASKQLVRWPPVRMEAVAVLPPGLATALRVGLVAWVCLLAVMCGRAAAATLVGTRAMCARVAAAKLRVLRASPPVRVLPQSLGRSLE